MQKSMGLMVLPVLFLLFTGCGNPNIKSAAAELTLYLENYQSLFRNAFTNVPSITDGEELYGLVRNLAKESQAFEAQIDIVCEKYKLDAKEKESVLKEVQPKLDEINKTLADLDEAMAVCMKQFGGDNEISDRIWDAYSYIMRP